MSIIIIVILLTRIFKLITMVDMRTAKLIVSFWISVTGAMVNVSKANGVKTQPKIQFMGGEATTFTSATKPRDVFSLLDPIGRFW